MNSQIYFQAQWSGMYSLYLGSGIGMDPDDFASILQSKSALNGSGVNDPTIDDLFTKQRQEMDPTKRAEVPGSYGAGVGTGVGTLFLGGRAVKRRPEGPMPRVAADAASPRSSAGRRRAGGGSPSALCSLVAGR